MKPRGLLREISPRLAVQLEHPTSPSYEEMDEMMRDSIVSYCFFLVTLPIRRTRFHFEHPSKEIADFVNENLKRIHRTITQDVVTAFQYGWAPFEKRFEQIGRYLFLRTFWPLKPKRTSVKLKRGSFDGLIVRTGLLSAVQIPAAKSFVVTHDWRFRNYYGRSLLEAAYLPWLMKKETMRLHALAMTDTSIPPLVGRAPEGAGRYEIEPGKVREVDHKEFMGVILSTMRARGYFVLPPKGPNGEWSIEPIKSAGNWKFSDDYEVWERLIALSLLVPREVYREGGGSYAKAREQSFWFARTAESLLQEVADFVQSFAIQPLIRLNFPNASSADFPRGRLLFENISSRDIEFLQDLAKKVVDSLRVDWDEVLRTLRVPMKIQAPVESKKTVQSILKDVAVSAVTEVKEAVKFHDFVPLPQSVQDKIKDLVSTLLKLRDTPAFHQFLEQAKREVARFSASEALAYIVGRQADGSRTDKEAAR